MKTFPMFLQMQGRHVVIAGGGEQAAQKCRLILKTEAAITILAPSLEPELKALYEDGLVQWQSGAVTPDSFKNTALVFVATGCPGLDAALHALAKTAGALVNVVDQPPLCDALTPSIVDRAPVVIAIGTEGTAPVLARQIKTRMEEILEPRLGDLAALAGRLRDQASQHLQPRRRRDLWRWVFNGPVRKAHAKGQEREAASLIKRAIETDDFGAESGGSIAVIHAVDPSPDLMTLRSVQRLQEADVIYHNHDMSLGILDLARRDAERVPLAPSLSSDSLPQTKATGVLISAARQGKRVVLLGDVQVSLPELEAADVAYEVVPCVTAAPSTTALDKKRA